MESLDLRTSWAIGPVEIPTRLVLAPMAGVSVQAFRRQGRRFGAGLVCSEMVSCAGIEHRLLVLGVVVLGVLGDVAELAGDADPLGDVPAAFAAQLIELVLERLVARGGENDVPQGCLL